MPNDEPPPKPVNPPPAVARTARKVQAGDVLLLTRAASPQFVRPVTARVIQVLDWITYDGWLWIDAYQLGPDGMAVDRRTLYFLPRNAQWVQASAVVRERRRPVRRAPMKVGG